MVHIHILATALLLVIIIGLVIKSQNDILTQYSYMDYNNARSKSDAIELMTAWQNNPTYSIAVKKIIFIDYCWMLFFGSTILYSLFIGFYYKAGSFKYMCAVGMVFLALGITMDAVQDYEIYRHLNRQSYSDVRFLTKPKFALLLIAAGIGLAAVVMHWNIILHKAFWKTS